MIKVYEINSLKPGKHLLVLGAIHGNEKCGTTAIKKLLKLIDDNKIALQNGKLTLIPICNPQAYEQNKRQCEINLNRVFGRIEDPVLYEEKLAYILSKYIEEADCILDLHAFPDDGPPFVFMDYDNQATKYFAYSLNFEYIITGWQQLYEQLFEVDTIAFAHSKGKVGICVECGNLHSSIGSKIAYDSIIRTMDWFGMLHFDLPVDKKSKIINAHTIVFKKKQGVFAKKWQNLDPIQKGDLIAIFGDSDQICAQDDGYILLPNPDAEIGQEWFYLGK